MQQTEGGRGKAMTWAVAWAAVWHLACVKAWVKTWATARGKAAPRRPGKAGYAVSPLARAAALLVSAALAAFVTALPAQADAVLVRRSRDLACTSGETLARIELVFGMSLPSGGVLSEAEWSGFIDTEVTPRFPEGFTVLTGYGQWRNAAGVITRETSRMLVIWHKPSPTLDNRIEAVRSAYKSRYRQESVLRVDGLSCVSF